jgi:hypothetical protein
MDRLIFPSAEALKDFSAAGINDFYTQASNELTGLTASVTAENATEDQVGRMEELQTFLTAAAAELQAREDKAARFNAASVIPTLPAAPAVQEPVAVVAAAEAGETIDVAATTPAPVVANTESAVVAATVTPASVAPQLPTAAEIASTSTTPAPTGTNGDGFTIIASGDSSVTASGSVITWDGLANIFEAKAQPFAGMARTGTRARQQFPLAQIRRDFDDSQVLLASDTDQGKYGKLTKIADQFGKDLGTENESLTAAVGWCAPSETDYSICSPITTDGLLRLPEVAIRRGGLRHTQGLDFASFFGNDFVLPITGYNILTEAQVIADTAKTCLEIPCPPFVDDRLNVAALCLTGSLLQNRGYPEFVATFVQGAVAAMAHLVNREVLNEIVANSTTVALATVDPWITDGSVLSQFMSAVEMGVMDMRYSLRTSTTQTFTGFVPLWLRAQLRADYLRQNARVSDDLADAAIDAMLRTRGYIPQWVYGYQDAFNPLGASVSIPAQNQAGNATPILSLPFVLGFTMFLPGTWVLGRADVIRLELVYDSTNLAQNQVTQLFAEDGFKPMRMCVGTRSYTINICPSGATGAQRAVACADITP